MRSISANYRNCTSLKVLHRNQDYEPARMSTPHQTHVFTQTAGRCNSCSAKVRRHVFSAVSHNIRIAGARGHVHSFAMNMTLFGDHIFPYGDLKKNSVTSWRLPKKVNLVILARNETHLERNEMRSRETRRVSRETRREVVTYFWAVLYM